MDQDRHRSPSVGFDVTDHVATITYDRPEVRNAVDGKMRAELDAAWLRVRDDTDIWVAIVTGTDPAFCGGADLKNPAGATGSYPGTFWDLPTVHTFESGLELAKPVIAAVNGACVVYGLAAVLA